MRCIEPANEERWTEAIDRQLELWRSCLGRTQILGVFDGNPALHLYEGRGYRHRGRDGDYLLLGRPVEETAPR
ncbi:hypothetical protein ACFYXS_33640 [Streptomyces sp. NPDC002574]|uniref:hypothetical protein n=1 Tax=Streptomyces sp. NPDC002574 TaxID=3364652 RepID=UPI00368AE575